MVPLQCAVSPAAVNEHERPALDQFMRIAAVGIDGKQTRCRIDTTHAFGKINRAEQKALLVDPTDTPHVHIGELCHPCHMAGLAQVKDEQPDAGTDLGGGDGQALAAGGQNRFHHRRIAEEQLGG